MDQYTGKASAYWGIGVFALLVVFAGPIASAFTDSESVQEITRLYFYIVAASYAPFGILSVTAAIFSGVLDPTKALGILFAKAVVMTVPLTFVGSFFGVLGIFVGLAVSNLLGAIYAARVMKRNLAAPGSALASRQPLKDYAADLRMLMGCR